MLMIGVNIALYLITCFNIYMLLSNDLVSNLYVSDLVYLPHAIIGWSVIREYGIALLYSIVSTSFNISSGNAIHQIFSFQTEKTKRIVLQRPALPMFFYSSFYLVHLLTRTMVLTSAGSR